MDTTIRPTLASRAIKTVMIAGAGAAALAAVMIAMPSGAVTPLAAPQHLPAPVVNEPAGAGLETIVLSGGCFWGVQGVFEHVRGVRSAVSGYAGGAAATASYEVVSTGTTGHAESVKVTFDPKVISLGEILRLYFSVATDPTQTGGQFPDQGSQYRGEIWVSSPAQREVAEKYIAQLNAAHVFHRPISTRVDAFKGFYPAERYHQDYLEQHPEQPYIAAYDLPKVDALKRLFAADYQGAAVLAAR